jgi:SAM-dependent methyltransferase
LSILSRFAFAPLSTRFFLTLRLALTPYRRMAQPLPRKGKMLDLGCGHGLFAFAAVEQSPDRNILGIDHDAARIALASRAAEGMSNLRFATGDLLAPPDGTYDAVALIDLMHYFDRETQEHILRAATDRLASGGTLIFRDVDPNGGIASAINRTWEIIATATGFTQTKKSAFHFRTPAEWVQLLERLGFDARSERCSFFLFADVLFVGVKR